MKKNDPLSLTLDQNVSRKRAWLQAARPRVLYISFLTVGMPTLLAYVTQGTFNPWISICALLFALAIQVGSHYINDALDFAKGVDTAERFGFVKVTQLGFIPPHKMFWAGIGCLVIALCLGVPLIIKGGWPLIIVLVVCVANGYLYTGGPYPLSYTGLGDLFSFLFYGLVGILTVYYLQVDKIDSKALLVAIQMGLLTTVMTALNNLRDIKSDAAAGKRTLAVRFGITFARIEITGLLFFPFFLGLYWIHFHYPWTALLPFLLLPSSYRLCRWIWATYPSRQYNQFFAWAILIQIGFSVLISVGFLLQ